MITGLILPIICKKYNISCILFSKDYKIVEFTDNLKDFVSDTKKLFVDGDIRDSLWELVGFEEKLQELYNGKKNLFAYSDAFKKRCFL